MLQNSKLIQNWLHIILYSSMQDTSTTRISLSIMHPWTGPGSSLSYPLQLLHPTRSTRTLSHFTRTTSTWWGGRCRRSTPSSIINITSLPPSRIHIVVIKNTLLRRVPPLKELTLGSYTIFAWSSISFLLTSAYLLRKSNLNRRGRFSFKMSLQHLLDE